jgi:hypothetical protein
VFTAALFTKTKLWKQPRCPTDERIKKMGYICTVGYYSAIKKNEIMLFAGKWMELENIMLNKGSQAQKVKVCMFSLRCGSYTYKINVHINTYMILYAYAYIYM